MSKQTRHCNFRDKLKWHDASRADVEDKLKQNTNGVEQADN